MAIKQTPFQRYNEEKKVDSFSVRLNDEERLLLVACKEILEQPKDSTALKQLAWIGAKVIQEEKVNYILSSIFKNKKNNARLGIAEFE